MGRGDQEKQARLEALIRPLRSAQYEIDVQWRYFDEMLDGFGRDYGAVELTPDFQRGHIWSKSQQTHYIENILRGVVNIGGLLVQFNCPNWDNFEYCGSLPRGLQCIDGLQRITAVRRFMAGEIHPFDLPHAEFDGTSFSTRNFRFRLAIHNMESRADLLQHYLDLNAGGTPHAQSEIERVRGLLETARLSG